ncbi:M56 family metallopeptidase [Sediminicola luteus]|uniref:Peptidase M56 domain-containing protein n=1 Tax=Sediminicola luteus TaxID=319238 RepID=A0A2A4G5A6_9FLAO|nr:M56 family metallopeptidase [Sediminicola luteus]PCE63166.1 hypothetical protein B7P33_13110 [Sediminicola luteus]
MIIFLIYLLKVSACALGFWLLFKTLLENTPNHQIKRWYLLLMWPIAFSIPLITFTQFVNLPPINTHPIESFPAQETTYLPETVAVSFWDRLIDLLPVIYILGVLFMSVRFALNCGRLIHLKTTNPVQKTEKSLHILPIDLKVPFSFFNWLFFDRFSYLKNEIPQEVIAHEEAHARQKHSYDVFLLELLALVLWFNPFIYLALRTVKLNHEFLADNEVLNRYRNIDNYQNILLSYAQHRPVLGSTINYPSLKKRFVQMNKSKNTRLNIVSYGLIIPLLVLLVYGFSTTQTVIEYSSTMPIAQQTESKVPQDGVSKELLDIFENLLKGFSTPQGKLNINLGDYKKAMAIYGQMSSEQKSKATSLPELPFQINEESMLEPTAPTAELFESWKNHNEYALWLNGKVIPNSSLDQYSLEDITHYIQSKVYKNARSKRFPQPHQVSLYTQDGFEQTFTNAPINQYRSTVQQYEGLLSRYRANPDPSLYDELQIAYFMARSDYDAIPPHLREKHGITPPNKPPTPTKNGTEKETTTFRILMQKTEKGIAMTCLEGCAWKTLSFNLDNRSNQLIDAYGMADPQEPKSANDPDLAYFEFSLAETDKGIALSGRKGVAWIDLSFGLKPNQEAYVNQEGVEIPKNKISGSPNTQASQNNDEKTLKSTPSQQPALSIRVDVSQLGKVEINGTAVEKNAITTTLNALLSQIPEDKKKQTTLDIHFHQQRMVDITDIDYDHSAHHLKGYNITHYAHKEPMAMPPANEVVLISPKNRKLNAYFKARHSLIELLGTFYDTYPISYTELSQVQQRAFSKQYEKTLKRYKALSDQDKLSFDVGGEFETYTLLPPPPSHNQEQIDWASKKKLWLNGSNEKTLVLNKKEIKNLKLEMESGRTTSFKLKIPGLSTFTISGNQLTNAAQKAIDGTPTGAKILLFDFKSDQTEFDYRPIQITLGE